MEYDDDDNFHNCARNIRYHFFENLVKKYQSKYLFTAHHGDDLMETVLMRIMRGSTLKGYGGFEKITNIPSVEKAEADMKAKKSEIDKENDRLAKAKATRETNMAKRAQLKGMDIQSYKKYTSSRRNVTAALNNVERLELELEKAKSYFDNIKSEFETEYGETYE